MTTQRNVPSGGVAEIREGDSRDAVLMSPFDKVWFVTVESDNQERTASFVFRYPDAEPPQQASILLKGNDGLSVLATFGRHSGKLISLTVAPVRGSSMSFAEMLAKARTGIVSRLNERAVTISQVNQRLNFKHVANILEQLADKIFVA